MPDLTMLTEKETLHFYSDYPHWQCRLLWYRLYEQFPQSSESLEARLRLATHLASTGRFQKADELFQEIRILATAKLSELEQEQVQMASSSVFSSFAPPPSSAITAFKLNEIQRRVDELAGLISSQNYSSDAGTQIRLARFVMLNPHALEYPAQLESLLSQTNEKDPLRDNLLFARIKLIKDWQLRGRAIKGSSRKI